MRRYRSLTAALLFFCTAAGAQPYYYPGYGSYPGASPYGPVPRPAYTQPGPDDIVRQGIERLKTFLSAGGAPQSPQVRAFLDREISPYFDFDYMAKWAGGALYQNMSEEQRSMFAAKLKRLFFSALARNLGTYYNTAPRIDISRPRPRGQSGEVDVTARVSPERGYPMNITFRFYRSQTGWKVFDVMANGTSAVAYYRKYFREAAQRARIR